MNPGRVIRERRLANGLTQKQLAIPAGSTQAAISRLERDEVSPTFETFERLLEVMGEVAELSVRRSEGEVNSVGPSRDPARRKSDLSRTRPFDGNFAAAGFIELRAPAL